MVVSIAMKLELVGSAFTEKRRKLPQKTNAEPMGMMMDAWQQPHTTFGLAPAP